MKIPILSRLLMAIVVCVWISSCGSLQHPDPNVQAGRVTGVAVGALAGGIIGNNTGLGTAGGIVAGGVLGGILGDTAGKTNSMYYNRR